MSVYLEFPMEVPMGKSICTICQIILEAYIGKFWFMHFWRRKIWENAYDELLDNIDKKYARMCLPEWKKSVKMMTDSKIHNIWWFVTSHNLWGNKFTCGGLELDISQYIILPFTELAARPKIYPGRVELWLSLIKPPHFFTF